jgi:hypothetical protein
MVVRARHLAMFALVLVAGASQAGPPQAVTLAVGAPIAARINGHAVQLAVSTGTVDHVTLNDAAARRAQLRATRVDNLGDLLIGGVVALRGRHNSAFLRVEGRAQHQQIYWFPRASPLPSDGTIGPFAFPHRFVNVVWAPGTPPRHAWPLVGGIDRAAYGVATFDDRWLTLGVDVLTRRRLPLVSASTGADLADTLGGELVGEVWQEEIMLGVRRPVRQLQLNRPLVLGPLRFDAVAVRVGGPRDGTIWLQPGQQPLPEAAADPDEMVARGRTAVRRAVARSLMLSRTQLEEQGCTSLTVAKREERFILACSGQGDGPAVKSSIRWLGQRL